MEDAVLGPNGWECDPTRGPYKVYADVDPVTGRIGISLPGESDWPVFRQSDSGMDYVAYGLSMPTSGTIGIASIAAGVAYISGYRVPHVGSVLDLTATSDNYIDLDYNGNIVVSAVAVAAGAPAIAASSIRLGYITTDASSVTGAVTGAKDSNGNWMGNVSAVPFCRLVNGTLGGSGTGEAACAYGSGTTKFDNSAMHSETVNTSRITATRAGVYAVTGFVQLNAAGPNEVWYLKIYKNGATASLGTVSGNCQYHLSLTATATVELAVNDYITLQRQFTTSQNLAATGLSMIKVG